MPTLAEVVDLVHRWYPPETADEWDAVGLAAGDPGARVRRILLAVDPVLPTAREAAEWDADLLLTHHPLFLRGVHGVAETTPKGRTLATLTRAGCGLLSAHTNADHANPGVSDALARTLGLSQVLPVRPVRSVRPSEPGGGSSAGSGRVGSVPRTTLGDFAWQVAESLPATARGVLVAGDPERVVRRVAVCGGAGDFLLPDVLETGADVYVTSDLRHHVAGEFLEQDGPALVDVSHWAAEWTWLPELAARLEGELGAGGATGEGPDDQVAGDTVEIRVSTICTDVWRARH